MSRNLFTAICYSDGRWNLFHIRFCRGENIERTSKDVSLAGASNKRNTIHWWSVVSASSMRQLWVSSRGVCVAKGSFIVDVIARRQIGRSTKKGIGNNMMCQYWSTFHSLVAEGIFLTFVLWIIIILSVCNKSEGGSLKWINVSVCDTSFAPGLLWSTVVGRSSVLIMMNLPSG